MSPPPGSDLKLIAGQSSTHCTVCSRGHAFYLSPRFLQDLYSLPGLGRIEGVGSVGYSPRLGDGEGGEMEAVLLSFGLSWLESA